MKLVFSILTLVYFIFPISCVHNEPTEQRGVAAIFNENQKDPRVYKSGADGKIYRAIGKVSCHDKYDADRFTATGSLINSCYLITNHHFWRDCTKEGKDMVSFQYDHNGHGFQRETVISLTAKGFSREEKTKESTNDPDWAIYRLRNCAETDIPKFNICGDLSKKELEDKKFTLAGLSFDRLDNNGLSVDMSCTVYVSDSGNFMNYGHSCASRSKTSGAPLFYLTEDHACLIGIHSGCYTNSQAEKCDMGVILKFYEENTFNFAIPLKVFKSAIQSLVP